MDVNLSSRRRVARTVVSRNGVRAISACVVALALLPPTASAAPHVSGEFPIPKVGPDNKIVEGPDRNMWVTLNVSGSDVAKIVPGTGAMTEYDLGADVDRPIGIAAAAGKLWVADDEGVTSFDPENPVGTKEHHTLLMNNPPSIVLGPDGFLWLARPNYFEKFRPDATLSGFEEFHVDGGFQPSDIDAAGNLLAISDAGTSNRIVTATTAGALTDHPVPSSARGVAGSPSGQIAFSLEASAGGEPPRVGLLTPPGPAQLMLVSGADPTGVTLGPDGAFWVAETFGTDSVARFGAGIQPTTLAPGFAKGSRPRQIAAGPEKTLWVTLELAASGSSRVGRVSGVEVAKPPPPPPTEPRTIIGKGPRRRVTTRGRRATVKFRFSSPDAGASFECRLSKATIPKKRLRAAKDSAFAPCRSPKTYRLKPGRYRFEVRAVRAAAADASPAGLSFRVIHKAAVKR